MFQHCLELHLDPDRLAARSSSSPWVPTVVARRQRARDHRVRGPLGQGEHPRDGRHRHLTAADRRAVSARLTEYRKAAAGPGFNIVSQPYAAPATTRHDAFDRPPSRPVLQPRAWAHEQR